MTAPDAIGLFGVVLYVGAYGGLQLGKLGLADGRYTLLNAIGGLAVIFSLVWTSLDFPLGFSIKPGFFRIVRRHVKNGFGR